MFSPMSAGRDKWDESGPSGNGSSRNAAGPSTLPDLKAGKTKGQAGKGKTQANLGPNGRILSPNIAGKKQSLGFAPLQRGQEQEERRFRRNPYATISTDGSGELEALLGSSSGRGRGRSRGQGTVPLWKDAFRPSKKTVDRWMESWTLRWTVLAVIPSLFVS
jgi:hypothetical protein